MTTVESFLAEIDAFLSESGMSASAFGKAAVGDAAFVGDVRGGRMPGLRLVSKVSEYIAAERAKRRASHPEAAQ